MSRSRSAEKSERPRVPITLRQIAYAVLNGRKITFHLFDNEPCTGYVFGYDDDNWALLVPNGDTFSRQMVPRSGAITRTDLHDESTFGQEPCYKEMELIVRSFRDYMSTDVLGRQTSSSRR